MSEFERLDEKLVM